MNICPVSHLPITASPQWQAVHHEAGYTTAFKLIGSNIIYNEYITEKEGITLDYLDHDVFATIVKDLDLVNIPPCNIVNAEHVRELSYRYKQDYIDFAYNLEGSLKMVIIYNVSPSLQPVLETISAIAPERLPVRCAGSYSDAIRMAMECIGNHEDTNEKTTKVLDDEQELIDYRKEFLSGIARMSWLKLFQHPVRIPEADHQLYPFLKSLEILQEDLFQRQLDHRRQVMDLKKSYERNIEEKSLLLKAQQVMNQQMEEMLKKEQSNLRSQIAAKEIELTRISTAISEKTTRLSELCRQFKELDIAPERKKEMVGSCEELIMHESGVRSGREGNVNPVDSRFLSELQRSHPDLNQRELRICLLIRNNLNTREISSSLGVSPRGVESIRYRLHKKLGLNKHCSIKNYLQNRAAPGSPSPGKAS